MNHIATKAHIKKQLKITNQRSPAEHGFGPFEGPSSYLQILILLLATVFF